MSATTKEREQVARKQHVCSWCGERIRCGERYLRYRYFDGGDAGTVKLHMECYSAMQDEAREQGGWIEWSPGDYDRPSKEAA